MHMKEKLYSFIYRLKVEKENFITNDIYNFLSHFGDPVIHYSINNFESLIPFSYKGCLFMHQFPQYDKQLSRICQYLKSKLRRNIGIVDIGANIGDTVLNIGDKDNMYLCVEGVEDYYTLLRRNLDGRFKYKAITAFCGENTCRGGMQINMEGGTAYVLASDNSSSFDIITIDDLIKQEDFSPDLIKIDTDGFDFKVLRGSVNVLKEYKPIVFLNG